MSVVDSPVLETQSPESLLAEIDAYLTDPKKMPAGHGLDECESLCNRAGIELHEEMTYGQMRNLLADKARSLRGPAPDPDPADAPNEDAAAIDDDEPTEAEKAAKLAAYQAEWRAETARLESELGHAKVEEVRADVVRKDAKKEVDRLAELLSFRYQGGPPTELPKPAPHQTTMFGEDEDEPSLAWEPFSDPDTKVVAFAVSAITYLDGSPCEWRIRENDSHMFDLSLSDAPLDCPVMNYGSLSLAKSEAEKLEQANREAHFKREPSASDDDLRYRDVKLSALGISPGRLKALEESNLVTIGGIEDLSEGNWPLNSLPGIGQKGADAIADALDRFMDQWRQDPDVALAKFGG